MVYWLAYSAFIPIAIDTMVRSYLQFTGVGIWEIYDKIRGQGMTGQAVGGQWVDLGGPWVNHGWAVGNGWEIRIFDRAPKLWLTCPAYTFAWRANIFQKDNKSSNVVEEMPQLTLIAQRTNQNLV
ncbi:MAG: hypothetical protein Q8M15_14565 [Bacteroidota bacterium]|nr:hypothetical protein [Bacteroidota bacterium]